MVQGVNTLICRYITRSIMRKTKTHQCSINAHENWIIKYWVINRGNLYTILDLTFLSGHRGIIVNKNNNGDIICGEFRIKHICFREINLRCKTNKTSISNNRSSMLYTEIFSGRKKWHMLL